MCALVTGVQTFSLPIFVTAISPTPAGEGKTTTTVGLGDGLNRIGRRTVVCLREPSLGPSFGMKGGAAGGGHAQIGRAACRERVSQYGEISGVADSQQQKKNQKHTSYKHQSNTLT